jgi:hypothetical protein
LGSEGPTIRRAYEHKRFCNKYVENTITLYSLNEVYLTDQPQPSIHFWNGYTPHGRWQKSIDGHYCRYTITDDQGNTIGIKYAGSDTDSENGAYDIEGKNN